MQEEAIRLGLTAFVVSFLRGGGCGKMKSAPLSWVCDGARSVDGMVIAGDRWEWELVLWVTFLGVAARVFPEGYIEEWAAPKARECLTALQLKTWEDVVSVLRRWPWVDALHTKRGVEVWERCRASSVHSGDNGLIVSI
jgi:hypothetical protein